MGTYSEFFLKKICNLNIELLKPIFKELQKDEEFDIEEVFESDEGYNSIPHIFAEKGRLDMIDFFISEMKLNINFCHERYDYLHPMLVHACSRNDLKIVKGLVERGADVNYEVGGTNEALFEARHNRKLFTYLLDNGVNLSGESGEKFMGKLCDYQNSGIKLFGFLLKRGIPVNEKHLTGAIHYSDLEKVKLIIKAGVIPTHQNVLYSVSFFSYEVTKELLEYVDNIDDIISDGKSLLYIATQYERCELVKFLLERGSKITFDVDEELERNRKNCHTIYYENLLKIFSEYYELHPKGGNIKHAK